MTGFQTALFGIRDAAIAKVPPHIVGWLTFFKIASSFKKKRRRGVNDRQVVRTRQI
jgi:hypothetical protein